MDTERKPLSDEAKRQIDARIRDRVYQEEGGFGRAVMMGDFSKLLPRLFPQTFSSPFGEHHKRYLRHIEKIEDRKPLESYVIPFPREQGKSALMEATNVLLAGRKTRRHALYLSATQSLANSHLSSIESKFGSPVVAEYWPFLGKPALTTIGTFRSWRQDMLTTESGYTIRALGLDVPSRGLKSFQDYRPDILFLDEIDLLDDSQAEVIRKLAILKQSIFPMVSLRYGLVIFGQNLIHGDSIMSQTLDGRAGILSDAIIEEATPSLIDMVYEDRMVEGNRGIARKRSIIISGTPTWAGQGIAECQAFVDRSDMDSFLRECQQDVHRPKSGCLFSMYDERYSVISWSEFQMLFGRAATDRNGLPRIPAVGYCGNFQDIGSTIEHPNANLWLWRPQQGMPLADSVFIYRELVLPEYPEPVTLDPSPLTVATIIHRLEAPWGEDIGNRMIRRLSHEKPDWANFYIKDLPRVRDDLTGQPMKALRYSQWSPLKKGGVGTLQSYMALVEGKHGAECPHKAGKDCCPSFEHRDDCPHSGRSLIKCYARPNPFRPSLWGRSRLVIVGADDQCGFENGRVRQPYNVEGLIRLRSEIVRYTEEKTKGGSAKIFDDCVDPLLKASETFFIPTARQKDEDMVEAALPERYRSDVQPEVLANLNPLAAANYAQNRYYAQHNAKAVVEAQRKATKPVSYYGRLREYDRG
jgi:hypothetical protein